MGHASPFVRQWLLLKAIETSRGEATIKSLVAETGMSDKTIRRDLDALREVGFPIEVHSGEFGRKMFSLVSSSAPQLHFTYDEALALYLCRQTAVGFNGTFVEQSLHAAFRKIETSLGRRAAKYVQTMLAHIVYTQLGSNYADKAEPLDRLLIAIEEHRAVFLTYQSQRSTEPVTYDVYPHRLIDHRGSLYLFGYSPDHGEERTWKLDRMLDVGQTEVRFQPPDSKQIETQLAGSFGVFSGNGDVVVRIHFAPSAARYVSERRMHTSQVITLRPDGSALVEFRLSNLTEVKSWILSFGSAAEVLEPAELRDELAEEVSSLVRTYSVAFTASSGNPRNRKKQKPQAR